MELDRGTPEFQAKMNPQLNNKVARVYSQLPLDTLKESRRISDEQWHAGDKLNTLFILAGFDTVKIQNLTDERGTILSPEGELSGRERAEIDYKRAVRALPHNLRQVTVNICCYHKNPGFNDILPLREALDLLDKTFQSIREENQKEIQNPRQDVRNRLN